MGRKKLTLPPMARRLLRYWATADSCYPDKVEDGGPGSGNWGHRGRPGLVGGSGKGGGVQYRGGRADIHYHGSRGDWLNGLTGERQHEAERFMDEAREHYGLKDADNKTVEQAIMTDPISRYSDALLGFMAEARGWEKNAGRLVDENLDESERKLVSALAQKYGAAYIGGTQLPDENNAPWWRTDELQLWLDLKSKAMGGPVSGKEPPEDLMIEAGLKEKPKPSDVFRKTEEEQNEMFRNLDQTERVRMQMKADWTGNDLHYKDEDGNWVLDIQGAEMGMLGDETLGDKDRASYVMGYFRNKDRAMYGNAFEKQVDENMLKGQVGEIGLLDASSSDALIEFLNAVKRDIASRGGLADNLQNLEMSIENMDPEIRNAYIRLKAGAMSPAFGMRQNEYAETLREAAANMGPEAAKRKYQEKRRQNAVVIPGDSFSEKIASMRKDSGDYTPQEIDAIGAVVMDEIQRQMTEIDSEIAEASKRSKAAQDHTTEVMRRLMDAHVERFWRAEEYNQAREESNRIYDELLQVMQKKNRVVAEALKRVRKTGFADKKAMTAHLPGRSPARSLVKDAYADYPTEWIEQSIEKGPITVFKTDRGYCSDTEIAISGSGQEAKETATHELGHRFERSVPGIVEAESDFYDKRTQGEPLQRLRDVTGNKRYRPDEVTRVDQFINPYIGKYYGGRAFELVSMGFERAMHRPSELMKDPDYARFILGMLVAG